jgi:hypothetical protein
MHRMQSLAQGLQPLHDFVIRVSRRSDKVIEVRENAEEFKA